MGTAVQVVTAADVAWSGGEKFNGYVLCLLALPDLGAGSYPEVSLADDTERIRIPRHFVLPIKNGVLSTAAKILTQDSIEPPATKYADFWYDINNVQIGSGALFTVTASPHTLTPPTLTTPAAATGLPVPGSSTASGVQNTLSVSAPTREDPTGTKDGSNKTFTISTATPTLATVYWNGVFLDEGVGYTRSGATLTMTFAPLAGDSLEALIWD